MNHKLFAVLFSIVSLSMLGCDDNASGMPGTPGPDIGNPGNSDDETDLPTEPCKDKNDCPDINQTCDICVDGSKKCDGKSLFGCHKNNEGCLTWMLDQDCALDQQYCDHEKNKCSACQEVCPEQGKKCMGDGIAECTSDANGCAVWHVTTKCDENEHCENNNCVNGCANICSDGDKKCGENGVMVCQKSDDGCFEWKSLETCEPGKGCYNNENPRCEYACGDDCEPFSLIVLPDTQNYVRTSNGIFKKQTEWIVKNKEKENIRFVMHMGDVGNNNYNEQYVRAVAALDVLAQGNVPYSVATGNHEYLQGNSTIDYVTRERTLFGNYINDLYIQNGYKDTSWFHGFKDVGNMYATFEVGYLKFAVVALEYAPRKDILCWADNLIQTELKDRYVIITTHGYLDKGASDCESCNYVGATYRNFITVGSSGKTIYQELAARHSNVIMVTSGHMAASEHRNRNGYNGNSIHEVVVDYQREKPCTSSSCVSSSCESSADAGNGWFRQLKIDPKNVVGADGKLVPNVKATTLSVLEYYQNKGIFYCSSKNSSTKYNHYSANVSDKQHTYETTFDFSKPLEYKYSDNDDKAFAVRDITQDTARSQTYPAIAMNRNTGAFIAVWEDDSDTADGSGNHDIAGRGFCAGGCEEIKQFVVNNETKGNQRRPAVAQDKAGNFVVVWENDVDGDGKFDIAMRGFDKNGNEKFAQTIVNSETNGDQLTPAIAMSPDGNFVVVWYDEATGSKPQVMMRGFNADGSERFKDRNVMDSAEGARKNPAIVMDKNGDFVVTWEDDTDGNGSYQIYARGFDASANERFMLKDVNTKSTGQQRKPAIAMNDSGNFVIAYEDYNDNGKAQVKVRGFDHSGGENFTDTVVSKSGEKATHPVICMGDDGKMVIGWAAEALNSGDIQRVVVSSAGKKGDESSISMHTTGVQKSPALGCAANGSHVFLFADDIDGNNETDILARGYQK